MAAEEEMPDASEEEDILQRSTKEAKEDGNKPDNNQRDETKT